MSDPSLTIAILKAADLKGLELLFDYTKFHIGIYLTMASAFITIASLKKGDHFVLELRVLAVWFAVGFFLVAGLSGGIIVSSITQCYGHLESSLAPARCASTPAFLLQELGPWELELFTGLRWTQIEHTSFWLGLLCALASFKPQAPAPAKSNEPQAVKVEGSIELRRPKSAA